jgi:hypothetical protein
VARATTHRSRFSSSIEGFFLYFSFAISKGSVLAYSPVDDTRPLSVLSVLVVTVTVAGKAKEKEGKGKAKSAREAATEAMGIRFHAAACYTCVCVSQGMFDTSWCDRVVDTSWCDRVCFDTPPSTLDTRDTPSLPLHTSLQMPHGCK